MKMDMVTSAPATKSEIKFGGKTLESLRLFFEDLAQDWDASQPSNREEILNNLIEPFDDLLLTSETLLEVGTGTGAFIPILKHRYPSSHLISIDLAHRMLSAAHARLPGLALVQADAHHLPLPRHTFDAIICHNAFPHFWWPEIALLNFHRLLVKRGIFLILHDLSREEVNAIHGTAKNPIIHKDLLSTGESLVKTLRKTGFSPFVVEDRADRFVIASRS